MPGNARIGVLFPDQGHLKPVFGLDLGRQTLEKRDMPSLPFPVFGGLVLLFLFLRLWVVQKRIGPLAILLLVCALQALIIAAAQHYQVPGMRMVQPITATLIPPIAWLAYQSSAVRPLALRDFVHLLLPFTALTVLSVAPGLLDLLIPAGFVGYGAALVLQSARGPDAQPRLSLESSDLPARTWRIIGIALVASAFSDVLIVLAQLGGVGFLKPWIISVYSVGNLILIGALSLSGHLQAEFDNTPEPVTKAPVADDALWARVQAFMADERPYLDPDLTLTRLARKLGVPAKTLSATINAATGENVSRYVNAARIAAAKDALRAGESVTNAMLSAGFNTKSNFNREFLRVSGTSPSQWAAQEIDKHRG